MTTQQLSTTPDDRGISRRAVLGATGGLALAAGTGLLGVPRRAVAAPSRRAALTSVGSWDLTATSHPFLEDKLTTDTHHTMQSFCFDPNNQWLFTIAQPNGGTAGQLSVTRLSYGGTVSGHMNLGALGHGVSMGAERSGTSTFLWTEYDYDASTDRGRGIQRFQFVDGGTPRPTYRGNPTADEGGVNVTPSVDHWNRLLALKYTVGGSSRFRVYDLDRASAGDFSQVLLQVTQPALAGTFQGWTIFGSYVYLLHGDAYSGTNPSPGNTTLSKLDLSTGAYAQGPVHSNAFGSMTSREPEGMAGYVKADGEHRLYFGFVGHSGTRSAGQPDGIDRPISIAYKNAFS
ncbi:phage baseplate protein [Microlunatus antarcticus]|uniref:P68 RBP/TagC-like beta-propeller domain-containing protein n=1 Tax=Microlunatus antarcticus TaxID=53388 RepID=A0A7W5P766_9ACTN|nr:teichoic acid biosynthesis protein C [Microlunatus antarcticus]MBB3327173.1 hypothetical protein [Microlunatus antarcticus]